MSRPRADNVSKRSHDGRVCYVRDPWWCYKVGVGEYKVQQVVSAVQKKHQTVTEKIGRAHV